MTSILRPPSVRSLPAYFEYFFLRFPGTLGPEEAKTWDVWDTYDGKWSRQGQIWVSDDQTWSLVKLPSMTPIGSSQTAPQNVPNEFGLQRPVSQGTLRVRTRRMEWSFPGSEDLVAQILRIRNQTLLEVNGPKSPGLSALVEGLKLDGWTDQDSSAQTWFEPKVRTFAGPQRAEPPQPTETISFWWAGRILDSLRMADQYVPGIVADIDTECLHQYRVWLRRARALVALGNQWASDSLWPGLKASLRLLQQKTNDLRDLDVLVLTWPDLAQALPERDAEALLLWLPDLTERRSREAQGIRDWFSSPEFRQVMGQVHQDLGALGASEDGVTTAELIASVWKRASKRLTQALALTGPDCPDAALHELRIQGKNFRYALDSLSEFFDSPTLKGLLGTFKESQDVLGFFQDRFILRQRLEEERLRVAQAMPVQKVLALGVLMGYLAAQHPYDRARALAAARRLSKGSFRKALKNGPALPPGNS